jgi:predicted enzyme involved in methoxymalonyl-ACP biosynthesis
MSEEYTKYLNVVSDGPKFDRILFNNASDLPEMTQDDLAQYDFQIVQIPIRTIISDAIINFRHFQANIDPASFRNDIVAKLDVMLDAALAYQRQSGMLTFVTNFLVPQTSFAASLKSDVYGDNLAEHIKVLNDHLARRVNAIDNAFLVDIDNIAAYIGRAHVTDDWTHLAAHGSLYDGNWTETDQEPFLYPYGNLRINDFCPSLSVEFFALFWRNIECLVRTVRQIDQVKLVIFDLDNTLWRGLIGDHYVSDEGKPYPYGWPEGVAEAIHHLRARGILVALCSKNDAALVEARWERAHPFGWLRLDDFVERKINWQQGHQHRRDHGQGQPDGQKRCLCG